MGSFMTLLCRSVYNVQCHIYEGIHSLTEQGCSDSDRDENRAPGTRPKQQRTDQREREAGE